MNKPSVENLLSSGSYEDELYASALGWKTPELFILNRAIVISVKLGVDTAPQSSALLPQYSVNARIIGEEVSSQSPENEPPRWYAPLMSNTIISVPEVGEQVFVIRETTLSKSKGFWIARVNDTDKVSLHLTNDQNRKRNLDSMSRYGMTFDVAKVSSESRQPSSKGSKNIFQLPLNLGDVLIQGRSGSYLRNSFLPIYKEKPGILEMGILHNKPYQISPLGTVGVTKTKTVHFSDARPTDITPFLTKISQPIDETDVKRNFIVNIAEEIYNLTSTKDAQTEMHRMVLGEKLNDYFETQDQMLRDFVDATKEILDVVDNLFDSYLDHDHAIPEINIDIPDKVVEDRQLVNLGLVRVKQPDRKVFTPQQRFVVPGTGDVFDTSNDVFETVTEIERPANGPPVVTTRRKLVKRGERKLIAKGRPGALITLPSKVINVSMPDKIVNRGYDVRVRKRRIRFDAISIGGSDNPRMTVPIETDGRTSNVITGINSLKNKFDLTKRRFLSLTNSLQEHLSNRNFLN